MIDDIYNLFGVAKCILNNTEYNFENDNVLIIGARIGFGNYIINEFSKLNCKSLTGTSRSHFDSINFDTCIYDILIKPSVDFQNNLEKANIIIFNAWIDININYWNRIFNNDIDLNNKCLKILSGFVKFLEILIEIKFNKNEETILIWIDADESKYKEKLKSGKHLEYNCLKSSGKQALWTLSEKLASCGIKIIMYDPGWIGYNIKTENHKELYYLVSKTLIWLISKQGTSESTYFIRKVDNELIPMYPDICKEYTFYNLAQNFYNQRSYLKIILNSLILMIGNVGDNDFL